MIRLYCVVLYLALAAAAFADQVTLKNGDRLSGQIVKSDTKELVLKSEFAGTVTIQWSAVDTISSTAPLYVHLATGETLTGPVTTSDGKFVVATASAGTMTAAKDKVQAIQSKDEEAAYEKSIERLRNPSLLDLWTGFVDTGLSLARGNANTTNFTVSANAARATSRDKITVYFTSLYSKNKTNGVTVLGADADRGGIRYDATISHRTFAFGSTDLEYDKFQNLDLRAVFGGGIGQHLVKTDRTVFDLFGGGALDKEFFFNNISRTAGEFQAGDTFAYKLNKTTQITESLVFYPNLSDTGQYRINFDASAVTQVKKWLGFHITLSDRYLSNPPQLGIKKNDFLLTTGIRISFAR
jgi:putative salt-induced outer membrane protein